MSLRISVVNDKVFAFDPSFFAQAAAPDLENWRIFEVGQEADAPRRPWRPQTPWRNEQRRNSRYEVPPYHWTSKLVRGTAVEYQALGSATRCRSSHSKQMLRWTGSFGSFADIRRA